MVDCNKKTSIALLFFIFLATACRSSASKSYTRLAGHDMKQGFVTTLAGDYIVLTSNIILSSTADFSSNTTVDGSAQNNILISITENNVTLDLNNKAIVTDKAGYTAIAIADNVSGTTIKNGSIISGSEDFRNTLLVGRNCSNIVLENITIKGSSSTVHATLDFKGNPEHPINNIVLRDLSIHKSSTHGISCSHVHNLVLEHITCSSINSSQELSAIMLTDCKYIRGKNIQTTLNQGTGETIGLKINRCKDAAFFNLLSSSNQDATTGPRTKNIAILDSYNISLKQIESTNANNAHSGISITNSKNVSLEQCLICNNTSGTNSEFKAIHILGSHSVNIDQCQISNCTSETDFYGIACDTATCSDLALSNIEITANRSTTGDFTGVHLANNELVVMKKITVAQNSSSKNIYGIRSIAGVKNIFCEGCSCMYNASTTTETDTVVSGFFISGAVGLRIESCMSNYNNGGSQVFGYYISSTHAGEIKNCRAQMNWSSSSINQMKPSAGFYLNESNYALLTRCSSLYNKGGNYAAGTGGSTSINVAACCGGFGLVNRGLDATNPNIGNQCIECNFDGNGTQLPRTPTLSSAHQQYATGLRRYWESQALAAGAIEQYSQQSMYKGCSFNNNGLSNNIYSGGIIVTSGSINVFLDSCLAHNNGFYGYTDLNSSPESYFTACLALGNGSYNSVARAVTSSQETRNFKVAYGSSKPYFTVSRENYDAISNKNSPLHNYNIT